MMSTLLEEHSLSVATFRRDDSNISTIRFYLTLTYYIYNYNALLFVLFC